MTQFQNQLSTELNEQAVLANYSASEAVSIHTLLALSDSHSIVIDQKDTPFAKLEVHEHKNLRWICDQHRNSVHALMQIDQPQRVLLENHQSMLLALLFCEEPKSFLNLGFGAGCFERFFLAAFSEIKITAVDISAPMIALARDHFLVPKNLPIVVESAEHFLSHSSNQYDLIFCDIFSCKEQPDCLFDASFYTHLANHLSNNGVCAINLLPRNEADLLSVLERARNTFAHSALIQHSVTGNIVLILSSALESDTKILHRRLERLLGNAQIDLSRALENLRFLPS